MLPPTNRIRTIGATIWAGAILLATLLCGPAEAGPIGAEGDIYVIARFDNGSRFVPAVLQYDGETGDLVGPFATAGFGSFLGMAWSPEGNLFLTLMTAVGNWQVREYDGQTGATIRTVVTYTEGDFNLAKGLTFGPDGDLYVGNFWLGNITRYDGTTFTAKANTPRGEIGTPSGMHFSPNGELLVLSGGFNEVARYRVDNGGIARDGVFATTAGSVQAQDMTFGPNGNLFVAMGTAGGVFEYDGSTGDPIGAFVPLDSELPVNGLGFDNYGQLLVSAIFPSSRVDAYDAGTGAPLGPFLTDGLGGEDSIPTLLSVKPVAGTTGIDGVNTTPTDTSDPSIRLAASPNPFGPRTTLSFSLDRPQHVELAVFDLTGKRIALLADREFQAGTHLVDWRGTDRQGETVSAGVYLLRLTTEENVTSEKILRLR